MFYCAAYSTLPCILPVDASTEQYPDTAIRAILEAAKSLSAVCPVTGTTVTTRSASGMGRVPYRYAISQRPRSPDTRQVST